MDCATYRRLFPNYSKFPLPRESRDTPEFEEHSAHIHACNSCSDWTLGQRVEARGAKVEDIPCVHIAYQVTKKLDSAFTASFDDLNVVVWRFENPGEYGIPIRDGGSSMIVFHYCPWCGLKIPKDE